MTSPFQLHLPRTGVAPVAFAPRRLRGRGPTVLGALRRRAKRGGNAYWTDVLAITFKGQPIYKADAHPYAHLDGTRTSGQAFRCPTGSIRKVVR